MRFRTGLSRIPPRWWGFLSISLMVVVFDQCSKWWAVSELTKLFEPAFGESISFFDKASRFLWQKHPMRGEPIAVIENFWHFRYVENPGAAWGFLSSSASNLRTPFFLIVSVAAMIFILYYFHRTAKEQRFLRVALAMVFGGAVGNFLDRIRLSYVIDFVDWHWYDLATWPTFNVADSAITVGVTLMLLEMVFSHHGGKKLA